MSLGPHAGRSHLGRPYRPRRLDAVGRPQTAPIAPTIARSGAAGAPVDRQSATRSVSQYSEQTGDLQSTTERIHRTLFSHYRKG
jgi:hypothetical protein